MSTTASLAWGARYLFVDGGLPDYAQIVAAADPGVVVVVLDPNSDGLAQIADALAGATGVQSVSIVSHGDAGVVVVGSTVLTSDDIAQNQAALGQIGAALAPGGDVLLYGCDVGAGSVGGAFIDAVAGATGAVVAASTDATGAAALGGNWNLEISTGAVEAAPALNLATVQEWNGLAATQSVGTLAALQAAIATDDTNNTDDTITLTADITFTGTNDTIAIDDTDGHSITIIGGGHTISGANRTRVLDVTAGNITLQNLTISNGFLAADGGSTSTANDGIGLSGGDALGAAIFNSGTLTITGSTITGNRATGGGGAGGLMSGYGGGGGGGGGYGTTPGGAGGSDFQGPAYAGQAGSAGHGGRGAPTNPAFANRGGSGGSTTGGIGGYYTGYTDGGAGASASGGGAGIGGGGGGSGYDEAGGRGGNAVGGIYNTGTVTITSTTFSNNLAAAGGGGGGSIAGHSGNAGAGGLGAGSLWNNGGTAVIDSATQSSITGITNSGHGGSGGSASGSNTSGAPGASGSVVGSITIACFATGTRIATEDGDVRVEDLRIGDRVLTHAGKARPVVWIGHRRVRCAGHPRPESVLPVRVRAHAFAVNVPERDLVLSPDHAVFAAGALIPVRYLVNGASIRQEAADSVTWWHVELDAHDVLLAEGLPAESYLDTGNRSAFANAAPALQLHPDFDATTAALDVWEAQACAPLVTTGPLLAGVRAALLDRLPALGHGTTLDPGLRVTAAGQPLAAQADGEWLCCVVPEDAAALRLASRIARPAELHATNEDWRELGVPLAGLRIDGAGQPLDAACFGAGWLEPEGGLRWTQGDAILTVPPGSVVELRLPRFLSYHLPPRRAALRVA